MDRVCRLPIGAFAAPVRYCLVATTKSSYDSALTGYGSGVTNFVDLLAAERDYARSLSVEVDTRAAILDSAAALAFAAGTTSS